MRANGRGLGVVLLSLFAAACAADVGDINRVQPNYVKKSVFIGDPGSGKDKVWYYRPTVTEVPDSAGFAFTGEQGEVQKIVWDLQEQVLVAYRSYEFTKGAEQYASRPGNKYRGAPIASFPVVSHFDIQREYNPATGEQTNVIVENTTDRPWYEREYVRVDWSQNQITDLTFVSGQVKAQALQYVQPNDPDAKDRPIVGDDYIDITTRMFVEPESVSIPGLGRVPECWLYSYPTKDCVGLAIKIRHSFMLAHDDSEEYEPQPHDDKDFSKFGYFATKRFVYDRERDFLEGNVEQFAERFNLWHRSRQRDASGQLSAIPYEHRALRPVVYYVNDQFPKSDEGETIGLIESAQIVSDGWDAVFRDTVEKLWVTGEEQAPSFGKKPSRIMFLCRNNPVTDDDTNLSEMPDLSQFEVRDANGRLGTSVPFPNEKKPQNKLCGPAGLNPQIGDLRYSFQYWVPARQAASPLGYGPHAADPENGRVIQANAFLYGAAMETYVSYVADTVALMVGDLEEEDLASGAYVQSQMQKKLSVDPEVFKSAEALRAFVKERGLDVRARDIQRKARSGELKHDYVTANLEALRKGWASSFLVTDEIVKAFGDGAELGQPMDEELAKRLNPSTWGHPSSLGYQRDRLRKLNQSNVTALDFFDDSIWSRAEKMAYLYGDLDKRARWKAIRRDLLKELYVASELHEVGHTLGLRHNFAATADALNYITDGHSALPYLEEMLAPRSDSYLGKEVQPNNYWSLRPNMQAKAVAAARERNPLQPAYLFPFDAYMLKYYPLRELQYSSIMDYSAKPNGDMFGLGKYDYAAIRFGYGQLVDVFDPALAGYPGHQFPKDLAAKLKSREFHYTYLPYLFANSRKPADLQKGIDLMVKGRKTIRYPELLAARLSVSAPPPVEVPYLFCSDEYVNGSSVCFMFDEGADMYEMTSNVQQMYENLYWFNNFKRGRVNFALGGSMSGYLNRIMGRYFGVLSKQYKHFVNDEFIVRGGTTCLVGLSAEDNPRNYVEHYASPLCGLDTLASAISSLNFFGRVLATPDVGAYGWNAEEKAFEKDYSSPDEQGRAPETLTVALGEGKYSQTRYDREKYGYNFYYKPVVVGSWWDKYLAIEALGDPYTSFIGVDGRSDVLAYLINFNDLFSTEVNNMVGGMAIGQFAAYAPVVNDAGKLVFRKHAALFTNEMEEYSAMRSLDPDEQYTSRLLATYLGISLFSDEKSDMKFLNSIKINVSGLGDTPEVPADVRADPTRYVEVTDPNTHMTYWATRYEVHLYNGSLDLSAVPLGFTLLQKVKQQATDPATGELSGARLANGLHFVDIVRGMVHDWQYARGL